MAKKKLDSETVFTDDAKTVPVANVQEPEKTAETSETVSKGNTALAEKRGEGVRIRIKDTGAITHVGWKTAEELISCGRAEVVDD